MKMETELQECDFLQYQLYTSSKMHSTKVKKTRDRIVFSSMFLIVGFFHYFSYDGAVYGLITFSVLSIIIFILDPIYFKILYRNHFSKYIKENYQDKIGKQGSMEIENGCIVLKDDTSETKIIIEKLKEIVELKTHYFIFINNTGSIILPKNDDANKFINILEKDFNVKLNKELDWKWK
ncbi:hypothetical protein AGMMS49579_22230 [Spirochaetia bacterium]|nr:hypothetical protein AGMMS49579_22230 [Spirochaetia bacterium]